MHIKQNECTHLPSVFDSVLRIAYLLITSNDGTGENILELYIAIDWLLKKNASIDSPKSLSCNSFLFSKAFPVSSPVVIFVGSERLNQ